MNKFKYYFVLLLAGIATVSCNKKDDDEIVVEPLRDYQEQYSVDNANIEEYLNANFITVTNNPGMTDDQDVVIAKITTPATQPSIMSYLNNTGYPKLLTNELNIYGIKVKYYYLILREGSGISPMNTDGVVVSYHGEYLTRVEETKEVPSYVKSTFFEEVVYPKGSLDLYGAIFGWGETFPFFKIGTTTAPDVNGNVKYENFGAGMLFLPSILGYYTGNGTIPSYSPLVFSFKLYDLKRMDHENNGYSSAGTLIFDSDGVFDYQEDLNGDGFVRDYRNTTVYPNKPANPDDTDGDGIPDFLDKDDDGDGFTTKLELTKPTDEVGWGKLNGVDFYYGISKLYPFDPISDNPITPNVDETEPRGIPRRPTGDLTDPNKKESRTNPRKFKPEDYTEPGRKRIHLDNTYPYPL